MSRNNPDSNLRGARLLRELGSASEIATRLPEVSQRSIQSWQSGAVPSFRHRQLLESRLGVPQASWLPAPSEFESELAARIASAIAGQLQQSAWSPEAINVSVIVRNLAAAREQLKAAPPNTPESTEARARILANEAALDAACERLLAASGGLPS